MVVEGRTITTLAELQEFCDAARRRKGPRRSGRIRLHTPQDMRVFEVTRPDGRKVYDLQVASAA